MSRIGLIAILGILVAMFGAVSFVTNPLPKPASEATQAAAPASMPGAPPGMKVTPQQYDEYQRGLKHTDTKWEKIMYARAKKKVKESATGRMVPSQGDYSDDWFKNRRDGQTGINVIEKQTDDSGNSTARLNAH